MKKLALLVIVFACSFTNAQSQMNKTQAWENSQFRVRTEHHRLMRMEISPDAGTIDTDLFEQLEATLLAKEGVIDLIFVNDTLVRMYYMDFVPLDYVQVMLDKVKPGFLTQSPLELEYDSEEVKAIRVNYFSK
jgi:hypothetical protein